MRAALSAVAASVVTMKWRLEHTTGDLFQLLNRTGEDAVHLQVSPVGPVVGSGGYGIGCAASSEYVVARTSKYKPARGGGAGGRVFG